MSRNPAFDTLLFQLRTACAAPTKYYGEAPEEVYARLAAEITHDMLTTYEAKDTDYAANGKPMGNLRGSEEFGIPPWKAVLLRMSDKKQRIQSFINRGTFEVEDEKVTDTLIDLANYALLGRILFREVYPPHITRDYRPSDAADHAFMSLSIFALRSKILHSLHGGREYEVPAWDGECWGEVVTNFEKICAFARSV